MLLQVRVPEGSIGIAVHDACPVPDRLNDNEGQNALLRARVERAERERREVQTRILQASQGGLTAATLADTQRKLDTALKELAFKEQEVRHLKD